MQAETLVLTDDRVAPVGSVYYGDVSIAEPFSIKFGFPLSICDFMATAIVTLYTPQGFVIAADGLRAKSTGGVVTSSAQKIFPIESNGHNGVVGAYSLAGVSEVPSEEGVIVFNCFAACAAAVNEVRGVSVASFSEYVDRVAVVIKRILSEAKECGILEEYPSVPGKVGQIARVVFIGHFKGSPCRKEIEFRHGNQQLQEASSVALLTKPNDLAEFRVVSGSDVVANLLLESADPALSKYRTWVRQTIVDGTNPRCPLESTKATEKMPKMARKATIFMKTSKLARAKPRCG